jgi:uncharacterized membrane protein YfcA
MTILVLVLGLCAGILTTLAGAGGGVLLIVSLSLLLGPHAALAATAPTLLVGNAHRCLLYRDRIDRPIALRVALGAIPGSLLGGLLAVSIPKLVIELLFLTVTGYAVLRALGARGFTPPRQWLAPAGAVVGGVSATGGGAGLILSPLLLSTGLSGERYIATSAAVALCTHVGRLAGYSARGLVSRQLLGVAALATVAVVAGNLTGDRLRPYVAAPRRVAFVENATLALCAALATLGIGR